MASRLDGEKLTFRDGRVSVHALLVYETVSKRTKPKHVAGLWRVVNTRLSYRRFIEALE